MDDEIKYEFFVDNEKKLWVELFIGEIEYPSIKIIDIGPTKTVKISTKLTNQQEQKLVHVLKTNIELFVWDYNDIKGTHPSIYTHHIYIKED